MEVHNFNDIRTIQFIRKEV